MNNRMLVGHGFFLMEFYFRVVSLEPCGFLLLLSPDPLVCWPIVSDFLFTSFLLVMLLFKLFLFFLTFPFHSMDQKFFLLQFIYLYYYLFILFVEACCLCSNQIQLVHCHPLYKQIRIVSCTKNFEHWIVAQSVPQPVPCFMDDFN